MNQDTFDRNIRSQYFPHVRRIAKACVEHGSPPQETEVMFEQYNVSGVEFILLLHSEAKDDVRIFVPGDAEELKARLRKVTGT
jgi:hypothetical protein